MKNLSINILVRVAIIVAASILLGFVLTNKKMFFAPVVIIVVIIVVTIDLIRFIHRTNNDLTRMLLSIREGVYNDVSKGKTTRPNPQLSTANGEDD